MVVNPDECIDCGLCEPECPTSAIYPDTDVPEKWKSYIEKNAELGRKLAADKA
jgi:ferredoxin